MQAFPVCGNGFIDFNEQCDCGIGYDPSNKYMADKLHVCQIITMLALLRKGGNFVLKI